MAPWAIHSTYRYAVFPKTLHPHNILMGTVMLVLSAQLRSSLSLRPFSRVTLFSLFRLCLTGHSLQSCSLLVTEEVSMAFLAIYTIFVHTILSKHN